MSNNSEGCVLSFKISLQIFSVLGSCSFFHCIYQMNNFSFCQDKRQTPRYVNTLTYYRVNDSYHLPLSTVIIFLEGGGGGGREWGHSDIPLISAFVRHL